MAKRITDEEYNQVSDMYDKFIADPNQDPAKVAKVQDLWNQVQEEYKAQKSSEPKINDAWGNQDGTSTFSYDNGTTNRFDQQGNNDGTVTTVYNNGSREITDQGGNNTIKTNEQLAREVLQGKRGNGQDRKDALANAGYDYNAVQRIVNNSVRRPRQVPPKYTWDDIKQWVNNILNNKIIPERNAIKERQKEKENQLYNVFYTDWTKTNQFSDDAIKKTWDQRRKNGYHRDHDNRRWVKD